MLEATAPAQYLRTARWVYAGVSGAHVLGIALLVGYAASLNLRLLGFWPAMRGHWRACLFLSRRRDLRSLS